MGITFLKNDWNLIPKIGSFIARINNAQNPKITNMYFIFLFPKKIDEENINPSNAALDDVNTIDRGVNMMKNNLNIFIIEFLELLINKARQKGQIIFNQEP